MAYTCGFFDSLSGDRRYSATQMSTLFNGIIKDGVFDNVGNLMAVKALGDSSNPMGVGIDTGRAWFNGTWTEVSTLESDGLVVDSAPVTASRIDAVVLEVDHSQAVRYVNFKIVKGTVAGNPVPPTLIDEGNVHQHALAYIRVDSGTTSITQALITNNIGTSVCPLVTGILETADITNLIQQWNGQFDVWMESERTDFVNWFDELVVILQPDVAANLAAQITLIKSATDLEFAAGTGTGKWVSAGTGVFTQTKSIASMTSSDRPIIVPTPYSGLDTQDELDDYYEMCSHCVLDTGTNSITATYYGDTAPNIKLIFTVKGR